MTEMWRASIGHYEVSDQGRARNGLTGRILRTGSKSHRYHRFGASIHNERRERLLHSEILIAFVGPRPEGMVARHLNGDANDNRLCNLAWGTPKENAEDTTRHGKRPMGESHGNSKLTVDQVRAIRASDERVVDLAAKYGVVKSAICGIRKRRQWTWLDA